MLHFTVVYGREEVRVRMGDVCVWPVERRRLLTLDEALHLGAWPTRVRARVCVCEYVRVHRAVGEEGAGERWGEGKC